MRAVGAIDQGTTSTRFMVFDHRGRVLASAQREFRQILPRPGWVEHDPLEIMESIESVVVEALAAASLGLDDLVAVGITNQRETALVWDRTTGRPLHNAVVWQDTRTRQLCSTLAEGHGMDRFRQQTGLPLATYFTGPKLVWLTQNVDRVARAVEDGVGLAGTVDSWLVWNLTGGVDGGRHVTDVTNASRTMLLDLVGLDWSDDLLETLDVPRSILPEVVPSIHRIGVGRGLLEGVPISAVLGDQHAALFGQACYRPGEAKNTYGTGCFMLMNTGEAPAPSKSGLLTTVGYQIAGCQPVYALEGSVAVAGSLVQWLRDGLGIISSADEVEALAASVDDNGDVYFVPAFSGLFAPHWRSDARGVIAGLTRYADRRHLARAALEATAYQTREIIDAMREDSGVDLPELKVDGGMVVNELLMQFQADILDVPVVRPAINETTALGAAYAAGLAEGFWDDLDEIRNNWEVTRRWQPSMPLQTRDSLYRRWKMAVDRSLGWAE